MTVRRCFAEGGSESRWCRKISIRGDGRQVEVLKHVSEGGIIDCVDV